MEVDGALTDCHWGQSVYWGGPAVIPNCLCERYGTSEQANSKRVVCPSGPDACQYGGVKL